MTITTKGQAAARVFRRASALLELNRGKTLAAVAETLQVSRQTVSLWRDNYQASGLAALDDAPRSGRPIEIDGTSRAQVTALPCSTPPHGHARWTLRLLADKAVELGYCERLSHTKARQILKNRTSAAPQEDVVHRAHRCFFSRSHGAHLMALALALRSMLSGDLL